MPEDTEPKWVVPNDAEGMTEKQIDDWGHAFFTDEPWSHIEVPGLKEVISKHFKPMLVSLMRERAAVAGLRHWIAMAGGNMKKPMTENKVMFIALDMASDMLIDGDVEGAANLLAIATDEVALSTAGKLDLDVLAWGDRNTEHQKKKKIGGTVLFPGLKPSTDLSGHGIDKNNPSGPIGPTEKD